MKYLFHLGHPAHFHLFKNIIVNLENKGHQSLIAIKKKDILEDLLKNSGFNYINILPEGRKDSKIHIAIGQLKQDYKLLKIARKFKPDILIGTSVAIAHVGKIIRKPSINVEEDDAEIIPLHALLAYPFSDVILAPNVCSVGKYEKRKIGYEGYHELAYLHPNNFKPSLDIALKYIDPNEKNFIIRFAKLNAHHDTGVKGISTDLAQKIIEILEKYGRVLITSERKLETKFEKYRMKINPIDIHHVMAFSSFYIGDSQTMAAEAGVLGIPYVRINDFVGKISYLTELEEKYKLGLGYLPEDSYECLSFIESIMEEADYLKSYQDKRKKMLADKIDVSAFFTWFFENYPTSKETKKQNLNFDLKFK